jgi:hypothetical protein
MQTNTQGEHAGSPLQKITQTSLRPSPKGEGMGVRQKTMARSKLYINKNILNASQAEEEDMPSVEAIDAKDVRDENNEEQQDTNAKQEHKKSDWKEVIDRISYRGIVKNMPYLIFVTLLCILYIANNNRAVSLTRSINDKTKELKELHWRYMDMQSRLTYQISETQLVPKAQSIGLKPLDKPPFEINITSKQRQTININHNHQPPH